MTDTRDAFEAWYIKRRGAGMLGKSETGGYEWVATSEAWEVWQAATLAEQRHPLTKEHIAYLINDVYDSDDQSFFDFARQVEAAHGIKA